MSVLDANGQAPRLLIVDDDPLIRLLARERLGGESFDVHEAAGGPEGVKAFETVSPQLVLLDVEMPGMNGFEVCEVIRRSPAGKHVPILILTGRDDVGSIDRAYRVGATDFATKPLNWVILAHRLRYILRASESFRAVREQQVRLDEVQQHARLGSWEVDLRAGLLSASSAFRSLAELDAEPDPIPVDKVLDRIHPEDRTTFERTAIDAIANRDGFSLEHRLLVREKVERIVHSQARLRTGPRDEVLALEGFTQDITHRRQTEQQVRQLAFSDSLTGLANRAAFKLHLRNAVHHARRAKETLGVLYLDVDHFKRVNDTFGHTAGDQLLKQVAQTLLICIRESDLVARDSAGEPDAIVSRLGGDEFTILIEGLKDPSDAGLVAERVTESLSHPVYIEGHEVRATASVGIAIWPDDGADEDALLRSADSAMYQAKKLGRANFQYYHEAFNSRALERLELEANLSRAISAGQLFVHFQPKLELATGRVVGCEALARWRDTRRGYIEPKAFVALAEQSGLISSLGELVLNRACEGARQLQSLEAGLQLAVNLSPEQIKDARLIEMIQRVLESSSFDPSLIEFEITESALIYDEERTVAVLEQLGSMGCRVGLDDFGTGYSSLSSLKRFPVQTLKIDRSFVAGIGSKSADEAIIVAILSMANSLGVRVVAEGVETEAQLQFLEERGCDEVQGFFVSRPLALEDCARYLSERASGAQPADEGPGQEDDA